MFVTWLLIHAGVARRYVYQGDKRLLDYVLFRALFQAIPNVKRLKPRQMQGGFTWVTTLTATIGSV